MKYCLDCDWSTSAADEPSRSDRSRAAIAHHVDTGHTIDSSESIRPPTTPAVPSEILLRDLVPSRD
ncbi:hypothetical protein [Natrinema salinisoli]|uniref:hypothetical protein n=1 Tax=Natrinema salinisoli TaxID=2878535 RepID=UPI001CF08EB9|nr:hypothetical protein [Natrinema salinisoli]